MRERKKKEDANNSPTQLQFILIRDAKILEVLRSAAVATYARVFDVAEFETGNTCRHVPSTRLVMDNNYVDHNWASRFSSMLSTAASHGQDMHKYACAQD